MFGPMRQAVTDEDDQADLRVHDMADSVVTMDRLKLVALDEEDMNIISAHVQDAVMTLGALTFQKEARRFVMPMNRFAWETQRGLFRKVPERRNTVLHFERVDSVRMAGLPAGQPDETLALLAIRFTPGDAPSGHVELVFSGGGIIRLGVECIEARLADLGGAWQASSRPHHKV